MTKKHEGSQVRRAQCGAGCFGRGKVAILKHAIVLLLVFQCAPAAAQECQPLQEYDEITSLVTERFYDKTFGGLDWPARVAHHRKVVNCQDDDRRIAEVVNALLSELRASHTALYTKADLNYWGLNSFFAKSLDDYKVFSIEIWP